MKNVDVARDMDFSIKMAIIQLKIYDIAILYCTWY